MASPTQALYHAKMHVWPMGKVLGAPGAMNQNKIESPLGHDTPRLPTIVPFSRMVYLLPSFSSKVTALGRRFT